MCKDLRHQFTFRYNQVHPPGLRPHQKYDQRRNAYLLFFFHLLQSSWSIVQLDSPLAGQILIPAHRRLARFVVSPLLIISAEELL